MTEQNPTNGHQNPPKQKPIASVRDGTTEIAIWKRKNEHGTFFDATHSRSYKDQNGDWQTSKSIPEDQLLKTGRLFEKAYGAIQEIREQDRQRYIEKQQQQANDSGPQPEHPLER